MAVFAAVNEYGDGIAIHKAGCVDLNKQDKHWWGLKVGADATRQEIANEAWSDFIPEEMTEAEALTYTRFMGCSGK
jgi:hypothetical protein